MLLKGIVKGVFLFFVTVFLSINVMAQGSQLMVAPGNPYQQEISLEEEQSYLVSLNLISDQPKSIVHVGVIFYNDNEVINQTQVSRSLGEAGRSYSFSLDVEAPEDFSTAKLSISVEHNSRFWWDSFSIIKQDKSIDAVREFWEEKLSNDDKVYTGLVVDMRGLDANRGMSPKVWSESGQLIYGGFTASYEYIQSVGLVFYGTELTPQLLDRIVADPNYPMALPLIVTAVDVMEPGRINPIISDEDANKILNALSTFDFLSRFSVIFLVD